MYNLQALSTWLLAATERGGRYINGITCLDQLHTTCDTRAEILEVIAVIKEKRELVKNQYSSAPTSSQRLVWTQPI